VLIPAASHLNSKPCICQFKYLTITTINHSQPHCHPHRSQNLISLSSSLHHKTTSTVPHFSFLHREAPPSWTQSLNSST
jgi:hypothetical protein